MLAKTQQNFRQTIDLNGIWDFKLDEDNEGVDGLWMESKLYAARPMPVPASYNDITANLDIHQNTEPVWYQRSFIAPKLGQNTKAFLVFESVSHTAHVYINDKEVGSHEGAESSFEFDVTNALKEGTSQLLSVRVSGKASDSKLYDYKGIDGKVSLEIRPSNYIKEIKFITKGITPLSTGGVDFAQCEYEVITSEEQVAPVKIVLKNFKGDKVFESDKLTDSFKLDRPTLWSLDMPYLYTFCVEFGDDYYEQQLGIRSSIILENQLLLNSNPVKLHGFNYIKDYPLSGRSVSDTQLAHDIELMTWMGANCITSTTSKLPEELLNWADKNGILAIEGISNFDTEALKAQISIKQNHPSLVAWMIHACEDTKDKLDERIDLIRELDPAHRPIFVKCGASKAKDFVEYGDVLVLDMCCSNKEASDVASFVSNYIAKINEISKDHTKPLLAFNFAPEAPAASRSYFEDIYSEDFQVSALAQLGYNFDANEYIIGEVLSSLADYKLAAKGQKSPIKTSGVFTRERDAKTSAYTLRVRWHMLDGKEF